jgi:hypothetical protein
MWREPINPGRFGTVVPFSLLEVPDAEFPKFGRFSFSYQNVPFSQSGIEQEGARGNRGVGLEQNATKGTKGRKSARCKAPSAQRIEQRERTASSSGRFAILNKISKNKLKIRPSDVRASFGATPHSCSFIQVLVGSATKIFVVTGSRQVEGRHPEKLEPHHLGCSAGNYLRTLFQILLTRNGAGLKPFIITTHSTGATMLRFRTLQSRSSGMNMGMMKRPG